MRIKILILTIILFGMVSCKKATHQMTVIKGCEGVYLRLNDKDHVVCNEEMLDKFENGTMVEASIVKDDNCTSDRIHCMMLHGHAMEDGIFRVTSVK